MECVHAIDLDKCLPENYVNNANKFELSVLTYLSMEVVSWKLSGCFFCKAISRFTHCIPAVPSADRAAESY